MAAKLVGTPGATGSSAGEMRYSDENFEELEKRLEWLAGPLVVALFAAAIGLFLLSRSPGF